MARLSLATKPSRSQRRAPKPRLDWPIDQFEGVDNSSDPSSIADSFSPDTLNTILDLAGSAETRPGYIKLLTDASVLGGPLLGLKEYYNNSAAIKQVIYASGTNLYRYDNAGSSVQVGGPYAANKVWDFDVYQDNLYAVNSQDGILTYNGTGSFSSYTSGLSVAPQYIKIHHNRMWVVPLNSSTIYFSDAGSNNFPVNNFLTINTNDGQVITGIAKLLDTLIVFKTDSVWYITGEPQGTGNSTLQGNLYLRQANSEVGCVAFRTIQTVEGVIYFMARSGIYIYQNNQTKLISQKVNGTFRDGMNLNFLANAWGIYSQYEKKYIVGYPSSTSTTCDKAIVHDLLLSKFLLWDDVPGGCAINFRFNQTDTVLVGDPVKGLIHEWFKGFADIAGDNGTSTGANTSTTLKDTTKTWTTSQFIDASVTIVAGTGLGQKTYITANTANTLTVSPAWATTPDATSVYSIGAYNHYWKSKIFDFDEQAMTKRFKYLKLFTDSENNYNIQNGVSMDFQPISYNLPPQPLGNGSITWGQAGIQWGQAGNQWGSRSALYKRSGLPGMGRYIQVMFGNVTSNQPWRVFAYSITYKNKKDRPS